MDAIVLFLYNMQQFFPFHERSPPFSFLYSSGSCYDRSIHKNGARKEVMKRVSVRPPPLCPIHCKHGRPQNAVQHTPADKRFIELKQRSCESGLYSEVLFCNSEILWS